MEGQLTYDTKCRRCGEITEWLFSDTYTRKEWVRLSEYCFEHFTNPSPCGCVGCGKETIQDYVAYTSMNKDLK
ncbi:MAG: hypothetical protein IMY67_06495 [Bacteroidetes bacterium]|nr:hypothetical protein [Bacteroidota bacterium]